jgi:hypothetical protein
MVEACSSASSTHRIFFLKNTKISIFGKFWLFWAVLGRFG